MSIHKRVGRTVPSSLRHLSAIIAQFFLMDRETRTDVTMVQEVPCKQASRVATIMLPVGLTTGDSDTRTGATTMPVGDAHAGIQRQHLGPLPVNTTSLTMQPRSEGGGTDATIHAMFRLIPQGSSPTSKGRHATNGTAAMRAPTLRVDRAFRPARNG